MPTGCGALTLKVWPDGQVEIIDADGEWKTSDAIPVPPHWRLIDADVLITRYEKQRSEDGDIICDERAFPSDYEKAMYRYSRNSDIISALKSQAAVIPAEEV